MAKLTSLLSAWFAALAFAFAAWVMWPHSGPDWRVVLTFNTYHEGWPETILTAILGAWMTAYACKITLRLWRNMLLTEPPVAPKKPGPLD